MEVKGPHTYLVRVPGNNRRFVHADHLVPDDSVSSKVQDKESVLCEDIRGCSSSERSYIPNDISCDPLQSSIDTPVQPVDTAVQPFIDDPFCSNVSGDNVHFPNSQPLTASPARVSGTATQMSNPGLGNINRYGRVIKPPNKLNLYLQ